MPPPAHSPLARHWAVLGLLVVAAFVLLIESQWLLPNAGAEADAACYLLTGKNLTTQAGEAAHFSPDPLVFVPEHMAEVRPGVFYPIYPIGYPALCSLAYWIGGVVAPYYVNPLVVTAGLIGVFFLARLLLNDLLALAATAFLALHPTLLYYGVIPMSHAAEFALATWCLYCTFAWRRRPRLWLLIGAAMLAAAAITARYTGALVLLPLPLRADREVFPGPAFAAHSL
jgi:4-amino-4-deoxy-L-arabinose transferase-like glycosyltransferase